jgi:hypothetical protein
LSCRTTYENAERSVEGSHASVMLVWVTAVTLRLVGVVGGVLSPGPGVVVVVGLGRGAAEAVEPTKKRAMTRTRVSPPRA